ncbi:MAG: PQQ-dependent sugar dehydrogenase [Bacteroidota bacterium]
MMLRFLFILLCFSLFSVFLPAQSGTELYALYCAGCHGASLEGNTATALIKSEWTYGRSRGLLTRNIQHGIPNTEMIAWGMVLNNKQIRSLVDYIVEAQSSPPSATRPFPTQLQSKHYKLSVEVLETNGIRIPWGIEFVSPNKALLTEQPGRLRWLIDGALDPKPIQGIPSVYDTGNGLGGLMDVALDPAYEDNGWIYLAYVHTDDALNERESQAMTRIIRGRIRDHQWIDQEVIFQVADALILDRGTRWGCRLLFDRQGALFFSIGDVDRGEMSQELDRPNGKVFRIHPDGSVPADNPFLTTPNALPAIYSIGNRNVQGMSLHPETGIIWAVEHGPMGGDELNILHKGANYGWPVITYGKDYDGSTVSSKTHQVGMEQPIIHWTPSISVCPAEFCSSDQFPLWKNQLLVGALAFEEIRLLYLNGESVIEQETILRGYGRIRDLKFGPDGALYVLVNKPDAILRIKSAN